MQGIADGLAGRGDSHTGLFAQRQGMVAHDDIRHGVSRGHHRAAAHNLSRVHDQRAVGQRRANDGFISDRHRLAGIHPQATDQIGWPIQRRFVQVLGDVHTARHKLDQRRQYISHCHIARIRVTAVRDHNRIGQGVAWPHRQPVVVGAVFADCQTGACDPHISKGDHGFQRRAAIGTGCRHRIAGPSALGAGLGGKSHHDAGRLIGSQGSDIGPAQQPHVVVNPIGFDRCTDIAEIWAGKCVSHRNVRQRKPTGIAQYNRIAHHLAFNHRVARHDLAGGQIDLGRHSQGCVIGRVGLGRAGRNGHCVGQQRIQ